jgi:hypothetical protein
LTDLRTALPLVAALVFVSTPVLSAEYAKLKNLRGTIVVYYDHSVWMASRNGQELVFDCQPSICGGEPASCRISESDPQDGSTSPSFNADLIRTLPDKLLASFRTTLPGSKVEIADPPAERALGMAYGVFISVRAPLGTAPARFTYYYVDTVYSIVQMSCLASEERYEAVKPRFDTLAEGMRFPRPAEPDPQ